jgi:hypothetical protein
MGFAMDAQRCVPVMVGQMEGFLLPSLRASLSQQRIPPSRRPRQHATAVISISLQALLSILHQGIATTWRFVL